ncbi:MAG: hypothetical protein RLY86_2182 [Pseudomonadota bacterium]|jgi:adenosylhomocysteine nucleosidase
MRVLRGAVAVLLILLLSGPALADGVRRIAVMSAFEPELVTLLAATTDQRETVVNGTRFTTGMLEGRPVVLVLSGISVVNAAMTTQMLLDRFTVQAIVFSGIAGGIDPGLHVGDVTVPARWGNYLEGTFARDLPGGGHALPPWRDKVFPNFGMIHPQETQVRTAARPEGEMRFWFEVDPALLAAAREALAGVELARCTAAGQCLDHEPTVVLGGNGITGPVFMDNAAFRDYAFATFDADALDMETGAVAHVAHAHGVPYIAFRSLSDLAGGDHGANGVMTFLDLAAGNAATVVRAFLRGLP